MFTRNSRTCSVFQNINFLNLVKLHQNMEFCVKNRILKCTANFLSSKMTPYEQYAICMYLCTNGLRKIDHIRTYSFKQMWLRLKRLKIRKKMLTLLPLLENSFSIFPLFSHFIELLRLSTTLFCVALCERASSTELYGINRECHRFLGNEAVFCFICPLPLI